MNKEKKMALQIILFAMEDIRRKLESTENGNTIKMASYTSKLEELAETFVKIKKS